MLPCNNVKRREQGNVYWVYLQTIDIKPSYLLEDGSNPQIIMLHRVYAKTSSQAAYRRRLP